MEPGNRGGNMVFRRKCPVTRDKAGTTFGERTESGGSPETGRCLLQVDIRKRLRQFSLQVQFQAGRGCLGILGASGCGKSMTLKAIAGIEDPDQGQVVLGGRVLYDSGAGICLRPQKRKTGYLFQNYALFPNMTVEQNLEAGLRYGAGIRGDCSRQVKELAGRFRLEGLEQQYPGRLSGGQQQRAALARIFACGPEVLLLDEPFSAMDSFLKEGLRLELKQILGAYEGVSVLVTHDRDEAYQLCDHLLLMKEGRVLVTGPTRQVFADPGTVEAARLTGCRNISRIRRLGSHQVCALDWDGLVLSTKEPVGEHIQAIGIRAHDLNPLGEGEGQVNRIPVTGPKVTEMPFEWYVTLDNGIWWKTEKDIRTHDAAGFVPRWLYVDPSAILLLE